MTKNRQMVLAQRPTGMVSDSNFALREGKLDAPKPGEVLVRTIYLSMDPTMRGWMTDRPGYLPPVDIGEVMRGGGLGVVVASQNAEFAVGDMVTASTGWQEYLLTDKPAAVQLRKVPAGVPLPLSMGLFGMTGLTAYFGLFDVGQPKPGETVVVSGAAGATGSIVGQLAKIHGCRVVGLAGSDDKCEWLTRELGFDGAINYKTQDVRKRLRETCPDGIDVFFDNVGGEILNAVLAQIRLRARVVICGGIANYNDAAPSPGPSNYLNLITRRARMEGFLILDYAARFGEGIAKLSTWYREGKLRSREEVVRGDLSDAPRTLRMLFEGGNTGKLLLQISDETL